MILVVASQIGDAATNRIDDAAIVFRRWLVDVKHNKECRQSRRGWQCRNKLVDSVFLHIERQMAKTKATMPSDVAGHKVLTKDDNVVHDGLLRCTLQKIKSVVRPAILVSVIVGVCVCMQQANSFTFLSYCMQHKCYIQYWIGLCRYLHLQYVRIYVGCWQGMTETNPDNINLYGQYTSCTVTVKCCGTASLRTIVYLCIYPFISCRNC